MDTTARYTDVASALRELPPRQLSRTFDLLARMRDYNDGELWERTGRAMSRTTLNQKRSGRSPIRAIDLWPLAEAVGVEVDVLLMPPSQAAAWLVEHRADELDAPGNDQRQHNGEQNGTSPLGPKGSRLRCLARQHNEWSYKLGVSATAA